LNLEVELPGEFVYLSLYVRLGYRKIILKFFENLIKKGGESMRAVIDYLFNFVTDQNFQARQPWVDWITRLCAPIHHHVWTSSRFIGGVLTIIIETYDPYLALAVFVAFALTDWIDGKVARYRDAHNGKFGAWLDGAADKFFVLPVIGWWGKEFIPIYLIYLLIFIEFGGYVIIYIINGKKVTSTINSAIGLILPGKKLPDPIVKTDIYEHNLIGKIKFTLQAIMVIFIWTARAIIPEWDWWPLWMNLIVLIIMLLAFFSVACKVNPLFIRYLADFITLGNVICGIASISLASNNAKMAAALIIIAAIFDIADGYVARKTKDAGSGWGAYFDDIGDFISFGLAPAWLFFQFGVSWYLAVGYILTTAIRLYYFTKKKAVAEGVFYGVPSTAVAIFLASIVLWNTVPTAILTFWLGVGAVLEVLFFLRWYHFRNFPRLPVAVKLIFLAICGVAAGYRSFGEGTSILFGVYLLTFSQLVAQRVWKWGE
jgi:CDP-diacylglycerol---serine O-phosphatidyltransferase